MQTKTTWFEIPSADFPRAVKFYETIFDAKLRQEDFGGQAMATFMDENGEGIGCVLHSAHVTPTDQGIVVYLDATPAIDTVLNRIKAAGGRIVMDKMALPRELGYIAHFIDSEGNRLALHAMS